MSRRRTLTTLLHLAVIAAVGFLAYSNTLSSSFQFDDRINILDAPYIRDLGNFWPPTGRRWFGLLTFALNYAGGGTDPFGYHLVNTAIHILAACSVYAFVRLTFRTPYFSGHREPAARGDWLAFACALLFTVHPVQTQAVTYIVQRFASLAALLFMLSLDLYILARLTGGGRRFLSLFLYGLAILSALLAMKTKETAFTLPAAVLLYEIMFISRWQAVRAGLGRNWRILAGAAAALAAGGALLVSSYGGRTLLDRLTASNEISRHDYLVTQFRVVVTYLRLLFLPVNQTIDYHYRLYRDFFDPEILASAALLALLLVTALLLAIRAAHPLLRLAAFGIFWFFLTLSIESSFIPIVDLIFEHRLYLPAVGAIVAVSAVCAWLAGRPMLRGPATRTAVIAVCCVTVVALAWATHRRNRVWENELTLWSDVIAKVPDNPRGYNMVGSYYRSHFRVFDAIAYFRKALQVDGSYAEARQNLGSTLVQIGRIDEGLDELLLTERSNRFDAIDLGILYFNIGRAYYLKGQPDLAEAKLQLALRLIPNEAAVHALLGELAAGRNRPDQAAEHLRKARELKPGQY